ncbi:ParB/RepB/Spo0J family partition protein [Marinilabiliaceae bacterium ANBcel2]|nr:ParB/RepB/Spo0J family partition protein [Marinilabiliaceae bacterium ANBcel2]
MAKKKAALGRGLGALIENTGEVSHNKPASSIIEIDISKIEVNPWQPRSTFDEERMSELAQSIKTLGIVQPLTLRKTGGEQYQIIAGERRYRAAKLAGLKKVPAYVREAADDTMLEMALVENIQREDLDAIEVAISYQRLIDECNLTQESLSEKVGKKRSTIANYLRLLRLPAEIQLGLRERKITMGHARAIINVEDPDKQIAIFEEILKHDLSVRKVEELVRKIDDDSKKRNESDTPQQNKQEYNQLKDQLSGFFKTKVQFTRNDKGKGKIVIPFKSDEELEKIISVLDDSAKS